MRQSRPNKTKADKKYYAQMKYYSLAIYIYIYIFVRECVSAL